MTEDALTVDIRAEQKDILFPDGAKGFFIDRVILDSPATGITVIRTEFRKYADTESKSHALVENVNSTIFKMGIPVPVQYITRPHFLSLLLICNMAGAAPVNIAGKVIGYFY